MTQKQMVRWAKNLGVQGDEGDEWSELPGGASIMLNGAVVILRETMFGPVDDFGLEVLAPICPDERGTAIPVSEEPRPIVLPWEATREQVQEAMQKMSDAIHKVYRRHQISIKTGNKY